VAYLSNGQLVRAVWEQSSTAAWLGFTEIMMLLKTDAPQKLPALPLLGFAGNKPIRFGNGSSRVPQFNLLRFVPRPACLPEEEATAAPPAASAWDPAPKTPRGNGVWDAPSRDSPAGVAKSA
jgi:hypothetical protein